jgi:hypothetical protein
MNFIARHWFLFLGLGFVFYAVTLTDHVYHTRRMIKTMGRYHARRYDEEPCGITCKLLLFAFSACTFTMSGFLGAFGLLISLFRMIVHRV